MKLRRLAPLLAALGALKLIMCLYQLSYTDETPIRFLESGLPLNGAPSMLGKDGVTAGGTSGNDDGGTKRAPNVESINAAPEIDYRIENGETYEVGQENSDDTADLAIGVMLSGEFGNHLAHIAHGEALRWFHEDTFGPEFRTKVIYRHQTNKAGIGKRDRARRDVQNCIQGMDRRNFSEGNTPEFQKMVGLQPKDKILDLMNENDETLVQQAVERVGYIVQQRKNMTVYDGATGTSPAVPSPLVRASTMNITMFVDKYYDRLRHFLRFNLTCCKEIPRPDESVFHFRDFQTELGSSTARKGFGDLTPHQVAHDLFGHLVPGDKVAIASRYGLEGGSKPIQSLVKALEERGLSVRLISGQSGTEDFCFLMKAKKELVGMALSTYVQWAAYLGDTEKVRLYVVDSSSLRKRYGGEEAALSFLTRQWNHPVLKNRIRYEVYSTTPLAKTSK